MQKNSMYWQSVICLRRQVPGKALDFGLEINKIACGIAGFTFIIVVDTPSPTFWYYNLS